MLTRSALATILILAGAAACSSSTSDAVDAGAPSVARGRYLVDSLLSCGDCHTPRGQDGKPVLAKYLSGVDCFVDAHPPATDGTGCLHSRNLTSAASGLAGFSDAEVKAMITTGVHPGGKALSAVMPYWIYSLLTDSDASAIVAYLRSVPAVDHAVPANEAPFDHIPAPATLLTDSELPTATDGPQVGRSNGRYLAALACLDCHSPDLPPGTPGGRTQDIAKAYQGARDFKAADLHLPTPPFPDDIYSLNLTPDATGIKGWTADDVVKMIHLGLDDENKELCPPMPFGPAGGFAGVTDEDAIDIANYLLHLAPVQSSVPSQCFAPEPPGPAVERRMMP